jgi:hypothetical protein
VVDDGGDTAVRIDGEEGRGFLHGGGEIDWGGGVGDA